MLLHVVTLAGDISTDNLARGQSDLCGLALAGIWLLGLRDAHFQTHTFHLRAVPQCRRVLSACFLGLAAVTSDLVQCCGEGG